MRKKLLRREFLKNTGIIVIASLTTNQIFAQNQVASISRNGNTSFMDKISKKTYSLKTLRNNSLLHTYEAALSNWQNSGYEASGSDYYVCQDGNLALFSLHLKHESVGLLDSAILCFGKNQAGEWKSLKSLSGFDLEILTVAAGELQKNNPDIDLSDYLLPSTAQWVNDGFCFSTPKGDVFIKTILLSDASKTEIIVKEGDKILFQQTIISEHQLSV
jgi:hypothetical protein